MAESAPSQPDRGQLLAVLVDQLSTGEVLLSQQHFVDALTRVHRQLTGVEPTARQRESFIELVRETNAQDPGVLLAPGVENWIARSVLAQIRKAGWGITEVQERGNQMVRDFVRGAQASALLAQLDLDVKQLNQRRCLRSIVNALTGRSDPAQRKATARLARLQAAMPAPESGPAPEEEAAYHRQVLSDLLAAPAGDPSQEEACQRRQAQKQERIALRQAQMGELVAHLDNYVKLGRISAEDADRLRQAQRVDEAMRAGKIDRDKGSKIRNSVLAGTARDRIERSVKEALDYAVVYLQVFRALTRIDPRFDPALRFLARHGEVINADADDEAAADLGGIVRALVEDVDTLRLLIDLVDRKDAEVRMIGARLPPYSHIVRRDQGRVERVAVDEAFIDSMRQQDADAVAAQLHAGDRRARARPAAAMICLTILIGRLIKPTPIRKEIRLLKVNLILEEFFRATDDVAQARNQAQEFLRTRLKSLYPDMSREETQALQEEGDRMLAAVEEKVVAERRARPAAASAIRDEEEDDDELSAEEKRLGVQIHRIPLRVAGKVRQVPQKIMPDPEDAARFVIAQRDPSTGELVPAMRRGVKRYVERTRDGWELSRD